MAYATKEHVRFLHVHAYGADAMSRTILTDN